MIRPNDLEDNDTKFKQPFDPSQPIEVLYKQIEDANAFAAAGQQPYTRTNRSSPMPTTSVFKTGLYNDACKDWRRKAPADKTWANFKTHFTEAQANLRISQGTTQTASGYHQANTMNLATETASALSDLASATAADRTMLANLTTTNQTLMDQVKAQAAELKLLRQQLQDLTNDKTPLTSNRRTLDNKQLYEKKAKFWAAHPTTKYLQEHELLLVAWLQRGRQPHQQQLQEDQAWSPDGSHSGQHHGRQPGEQKLHPLMSN